jgi:hypothetical protein
LSEISLPLRNVSPPSLPGFHHQWKASPFSFSRNHFFHFPGNNRLQL